MNVEDIVWKDDNLDQKVLSNTKKGEIQQSGKDTIMWQMLMTKSPPTFDLPTYFIVPLKIYIWCIRGFVDTTTSTGIYSLYLDVIM